MKRYVYGSELSKAQLEKMGIKDVQVDENGQATILREYKKPKGKIEAIPIKTQTHGTTAGHQYVAFTPLNQKGTVRIWVHRIVYAWCRGPLKKGEVIHHKNHIKADNRLDNLIPMTAGEHTAEERGDWHQVEYECDLTKPLSYYEEKLKQYTEQYETSKLLKDKELRESLRARYATYKARYEGKIRYWKSHQKEVV